MNQHLSAGMLFAALLFCATYMRPLSAQPKPLAFDASSPTNVVFSDLLQYRGLTIESKSGNLRLGELRLAFLPESEEGGAKAEYGILDNQHRITATLSKGGTEAGKFIFNFDSREGAFSTVRATSSDGYVESVKFTESADCVLDFFVDAKKIFSFPFRVEKKSSSDAYAKDGARYFLTGAWSEYGYIQVSNNEKMPIKWFFFLCNQNLSGNESIDVFADVELFKDGKLYGSWNQQAGVKGNEDKAAWLGANRIWRAVGDGDGMPLYTLNKENGEIMLPSHLKDGKYEIRITYYDKQKIRDKPKMIAGQFQSKPGADVFAFEIKGGKVVPQGRQVSAPSPELMIQGGRFDTFVIRKGSKLN